MYYEIGKFRGHTLWMGEDNIPNDTIDEDMYVNRHDYSVWYKGQKVGYMKSDRSCIEPFYDRLYYDLKNSKPFTPIKKKVKKEKEVAPAPESIPTSSLLDNELKFDNSIFKSFADYIDNELKILKEKEYDN